MLFVYRSQPGECDAPFDKAGNTASRGPQESHDRCVRIR